MLSRFLTHVAPLVFGAGALGGCGLDLTATPDRSAEVSPAPTGPVTLEWQEQARNLVSANRFNPLAAARAYAALSVAQHGALTEADKLLADDEGQSDGFGPGGRSRFEARRGAVAGASARVLGFFFPAAADALNQKLEGEADDGPGQTHPAFQRGVAIGRSAGDAMIERLQNDGFTSPWTGTVPTGPGIFIPVSLPPAGAAFGNVKPYFMTSGSQFRPAPPPPFGSVAFNTDLNEVLTRTQNLTPDQLAFARYWDFPSGTPTPIGYWNGVAADYTREHNLNERAATQVFALMHAAMFDALIGCWDAKYYYWTIRPSQANPAISLAFALPNHPSYPSGHSCSSSAASRVLTHFFPERAAELASQVGDAGFSRILAGIHYRFDITAGQTIGTAAAELAIDRFTR